MAQHRDHWPMHVAKFSGSEMGLAHILWAVLRPGVHNSWRLRFREDVGHRQFSQLQFEVRYNCLFWPIPAESYLLLGISLIDPTQIRFGIGPRL